MVTLFESTIGMVNENTLRDIREKYPDAVVRIEAERLLHSERMDEQQFWSIIAKLDWKQPTPEAVMRPAIEALGLYSVESINTFYDLLAEKLYALDAQRFAEHLGSNRYTGDGSQYFSVDDFLYARCGVVARGKDFYDFVMQNPARMPKEFTFSSLLFLPHQAYSRQTGLADYPHVTETWFETFSNPEGWPGITPLKTIVEQL